MNEIDHMFRATREMLDTAEMAYKRYGIDSNSEFHDLERAFKHLTAVYDMAYLNFFGESRRTA